MELPKVFGYIGLATSGLLLLRAVQAVYIYIRPSSIHRYLKEGEGNTWAFISGASDGIGHAFAQELCSRGFNVFLHGREKLLRVQEGLRTEFPSVQTKIVVYDASHVDKSIDDIATQIGDGTRLSVLVNNVGGMGMMHPSPYIPLQDYTFEDMQTVINVNATFAAHLTRVLLPLLLQNQPSLIINCSSAAKFGMPWLTPYAATKAFNIGLSDALAAEMRADGHDVEVLGLIVGSVRSMSNRPVGKSVFIPDSRGMAAAALDRVGCGELSVWPYWAHRLQGIGLDILSQKMFQDLATKEVRKLRQEIWDQEERKKIK
jgi:short-subunit dehydrogenase